MESDPEGVQQGETPTREMRITGGESSRVPGFDSARALAVFGMGFLALLGKLENQTLAFAMSSALVFCLIAIIFSTLWLAKYPAGPLETMMRRLTG